MTDTQLEPARPVPLARLFVLAGLGAGLLWAYWPVLTGMARRWGHDAQYSHGYLVPLFAGALLWLRRDRLAGLSWQPSWWGVLPLTAAAALGLAGAYYSVAWLEAVSLLPVLAGLSILCGGWRSLRWSWPAIAFLLFMIPLPHRAEVALAHPLQRMATWASTYALQTLGLPALAEGNIILLKDVKIGVVAACSGLSMLLIFFALATAVIAVTRRPLGDKLLILASAVPIAVVANVVRITVTGVLHVTAGSHVANLVFHDWAGWLMMPLALALLGLELWILSRLFVTAAPTALAPLDLGSPQPSSEGHAPRPPLPPRHATRKQRRALARRSP